MIKGTDKKKLSKYKTQFAGGLSSVKNDEIFDKYVRNLWKLYD